LILSAPGEGESPLSVLLTIQSLEGPAGGSLYVRDFAIELFRQGHHPVVYCCRPGAISDQLTAAGIAVTDSVDKLGHPDIIHGNTPIETAAAVLALPNVPAVFVCHGWDSPDALAPLLPRILRYLAVSEISRDRLIHWDGVPESRVVMHQNPVDLERFARRPEAATQLRQALVFSNTLTENNQLPIVREACRQSGITLNAVGEGVQNVSLHPEHLLKNYDLVFARGRCALEALASGCAVILCDELGLGELITTENYDILRLRNFGRRTFQLPFTADAIRAQLGRYDPRDAQKLTTRVRERESLFAATEVLTGIYREVIRELAQQGGTCAEQERLAAARFLQAIAPHANTFDLARRKSEAKLRSLRETMSPPPLRRSELRRIRLSAGLASGVLTAGSRAAASLSVENATKHVLASLGPTPLFLSYHWLDERGKPVIYDGIRTELFPPLPPGRTFVYAVNVIAPDQPGEYRLRLSVVQEQVAWVDHPVCEVRCRVEGRPG
jgi:hypothetical protein